MSDRPRDVLVAALERFPEQITATDAHGWFAHAGYAAAHRGSNRPSP